MAGHNPEGDETVRCITQLLSEHNLRVLKTLIKYTHGTNISELGNTRCRWRPVGTALLITEARFAEADWSKRGSGRIVMFRMHRPDFTQDVQLQELWQL